jgi:hypothetical protein
LFSIQIDLFEDKLKREPLSKWLPEYTGDNSTKDAAKFIESKFLATNKTTKLIFAHCTCATDTTNVERVFEACKAAILNVNINQMGDLEAGMHLE